MAKRNIRKGAKLHLRRFGRFENQSNVETKINGLKKEEALMTAIKNVSNDKPDVHIISRSGNWVVKVSGSSRAYKLVPTKNQAIKYARQLSSSPRIGNVIIHKKDGSIDIENVDIVIASKES